MRAVTQRSFGGPDVLEVVETELPQPGPAQVLVRVEAIGLNPVEAYIRAGHFPLLGPPPFTLGWDIAGVVERVTHGVYRLAEGDRVFGMPAFPGPAAGYAEYVAARSRHLARVPDGLDAVSAAALPLAGLTAWQSLVDGARVRPGQHVLVHAAGGGVGHLAVQIAKALGARVTATASARKVAFVKGLGADTVIDYREGDLADQVRDVDVVLDGVGGDTAERSLPVLRPGGILVTIVRHSDPALRAAVEASGRRFVGVGVEADSAGLDALADLVRDGKLRVHVQETFPLARIADAHRALEAGHLTGKLVVTP